MMIKKGILRLSVPHVIGDLRLQKSTQKANAKLAIKEAKF